MNYYADGGMAMSAQSQELPPSQIIAADFGRKATPEEVQQALLSLESLAEQDKLFILQENNTVAVLISIGDSVIEAHLFSVDIPITMARALKTILAELKRSHIKRMYSNVDEDTPKILALMQNFGIEAMESDNPEYVWMADL
jgi:hypothetical protein